MQSNPMIMLLGTKYVVVAHFLQKAARDTWEQCTQTVSTLKVHQLRLLPH